MAAGFAVLVAGAARTLPVEQLVAAGGPWEHLRVLAVGALGAGATNNLPAALATVPVVHGKQIWPLLFALNAAPAFVLTGALSSLLWRLIVADAGLQVSTRRFSEVGLRMAGPDFVAGASSVMLVS